MAELSAFFPSCQRAVSIGHLDELEQYGKPSQSPRADPLPHRVSGAGAELLLTPLLQLPLLTPLPLHR